MDRRQPSRLRSTAAINGHPLHPLLVTLPIGFLIGTLLSDLAFQATGDSFWARASAWLIGAGLVSGALAALAGFIDFIASEAIRSLSLVWYHFIGNAVALMLSAHVGRLDWRDGHRAAPFRSWSSSSLPSPAGSAEKWSFVTG